MASINKQRKQQEEALREAQKVLSFEAQVKSINGSFLDRVDNYLSETLLECDEPNSQNPQFVAEFSKDIMSHYLATESMN